jgi:N-carbamoylputrescine amidase
VNRVGFEADPSKSRVPSHSNFTGVGPEGESGINFWGRSFITDPDGKIVKQASQEKEEILLCTIDLTLVEETKKRFSFPYRDRRVDSYKNLLKLYLD